MHASGTRLTWSVRTLNSEHMYNHGTCSTLTRSVCWPLFIKPTINLSLKASYPKCHGSRSRGVFWPCEFPQSGTRGRMNPWSGQRRADSKGDTFLNTPFQWWFQIILKFGHWVRWEMLAPFLAWKVASSILRGGKRNQARLFAVKRYANFCICKP